MALEISEFTSTIGPRQFLSCLEAGIDRTLTQDPLFGFRLLNDIALRALSTATNDPASAVQALDSIETLLLALAPRDLAIGVIVDDTDTPRVVFDAPDWEAFLAAGADEITSCEMHPIVRRRLHTMLEKVLAAAPTEHRAGVEQRITDLARA